MSNNNRNLRRSQFRSASDMIDNGGSEPPAKRQRMENNDNHHNHNNNNNDDDIIIINQYQLADLKTWTLGSWETIIRIIHKSKLQKIKNKNWFYILITDCDSTLRRVTFWEEQALNWHRRLKVGQLYNFQKATIKSEQNAKYAFYGNCYFQCNVNTVFVKEENSEQIILNQIWEPIEQIKDIEGMNEDEMIDVFGFITDLEEIKTVNRRGKSAVDKQTFTLADKSAKISVTAWSQTIEAEIKKGQMIGIKKAKISKWNARSLDVCGHIELKPQHDLVDELKEWQQREEKSVYALLKDVRNISDPNIKGAKKKFNFESAPIKSIPWISYKALSFRQTQQLPAEKCFKVEAKVKNVDGTMFFEKENQTFWRLKLTLCNDDGKWFKATAFEMPAKVLMEGLEAEKGKQMCEEQPKEFSKIIDKLLNNQKYMFGVHVKENTFFNPARLDFVIDEACK